MTKRRSGVRSTQIRYFCSHFSSIPRAYSAGYPILKTVAGSNSTRGKKNRKNAMNHSERHATTQLQTNLRRRRSLMVLGGPTEGTPAAAAAFEVPIAGVPTYCVELSLETDCFVVAMGASCPDWLSPNTSSTTAVQVPGPFSKSNPNNRQVSVTGSPIPHASPQQLLESKSWLTSWRQFSLRVRFDIAGRIASTAMPVASDPEWRRHTPRKFRRIHQRFSLMPLQSSAERSCAGCFARTRIPLKH